jgi:3-dehydroquinate synthase
MVADGMAPSRGVTGSVVLVPAGNYQIMIAPGSLDHAAEIVQRVAPAHRYAIISDSNVAPLHGERVRRQFGDDAVELYVVPAGESYKTRESWSMITDRLLKQRFGRDSTIIALGGGVVCDLAGFVAATFLRGVPVVHIPTTLLAMIDASIGGKTGVDTPVGKNLVGAFHPPRAVVVDPYVLDTLPLAELRSGFAEAIKHGAIADAGYFEFLRENAPAILRDGSDAAGAGRDVSLLAHVIQESVRIKAGVVTADEREKGERKSLNFGHTIGHAIELLSGFTLRHGEAVALGMILESEAAERAGITEPGTTAQVTAAVERAGLPTRRPAGASAAQILDVMLGDKKTVTGWIEYAVPARIGVMAAAGAGHTVRLPDSLIAEVLEATPGTVPA